MEYELAKKLKDAGFPKINYHCKKGIAGEHNCRANKPDCDLMIYDPTLSELIKACGDDFDSLYRGSDGKWLAESPLMAFSGGTEYVCRSSGDENTPEEAVANLWLQLNK